VHKRSAALSAADDKEKQEREAMMPSKEVSERKKDADSQEKPKDKVPTNHRLTSARHVVASSGVLPDWKSRT
jgi:hypothetical protein